MNPTSATLLILAALGMSSCGLLMAPVRIGGSVVKGTAELTEAAVTAPVDAHRKRKDRKEREKQEKEKKGPSDKSAKPIEDLATPAGDPSPANLPPVGTPPPDSGDLPDYGPDLPPLPDDFNTPPP